LLFKKNYVGKSFGSQGEAQSFDACYFLLAFFRIKAQAIVDIPHNITIEEKEGEMVPLMDVEVQHAAAVIAAAFLNPGKQNQY
jgi:hypothetical protein